MIVVEKKYQKVSTLSFTYGTAGFRMDATLLPSIMFTVGIISVLRSMALGGKHIGVMITASHNPENDNGVKLCEPMGEMLIETWERYAILLANTDQIDKAVNEIIDIEKIDTSIKPNVLVGRDTRPSGDLLLQAFKDGVKSISSTTISDFGLVTTPQLHYLTRCLNDPSYGAPTIKGYYEKLALSFKNVVKGFPTPSPLTVDCANGVGAMAIKDFLKICPELNCVLTHTDTKAKGVLNFECGADYVKIGQKPPKSTVLTKETRACSFDGDADRIVFYYKNDRGFVLLDGDKIATLAAAFIMSLIEKSGVKADDGTNLKVGLVQTAYANGASTKYVNESLKVPVVFTPTGVKHLHHEAAHFDVGVYFEANGHGTVLFSPRAVDAFKQSDSEYANRLYNLSNLINQTVGDALSDSLMVEAILRCTNQDFSDWNSCYTDLPSKQEKVKVANRSDFQVYNADRQLSQPHGLQQLIDEAVKGVEQGRCFVRPSGTEDVVRVYAEAKTKDEMERLCYTVCGIVFDGFGGKGERPVHFLRK